MIIGNKIYKDEDVQKEIFDKRIRGEDHNLKEQYTNAQDDIERLDIIARAFGLKD